LRLVQLLRIPLRKLDLLSRFLGRWRIMTPEGLSIAQLAIRKGLHGDYYPLPPV
jgi:hypothetical protein